MDIMDINFKLLGEILVTSLVASGAAWAIVSYLCKTLITQKLAEELEAYKNNLRIEVESFKLYLNKELHGFSTQFSRLDQQRSDGIMEIHGLICDIEQLVIWTAGPESSAIICQSPESRTMDAMNKAWEGIAKLNHLLNYHSLLLSESVYLKVQAWSKNMMEIVATIGNEVERVRRISPAEGQDLIRRESIISRIRSDHLDSRIPEIGSFRKELEIEFREILGVAAPS